MPEVSVIIPTYNGRHKIGKTLKSLREQSFKDFETVVVVDGSTDDTTSYLKNEDWGLQKLRVKVQSNKGRAVVRNNGANYARGDFLIFFDDDVIVDRLCVESHLSMLREHQGMISAGRAIEGESVGSSDFQNFKVSLAKKWEENLLAASLPLEEKDLFMAAANFGINKTDFLRLGGFDEELKDAEDFEFVRRAHSRGIRTFYNTTAVAVHNDPVTCKEYILRLRDYKRSHERLALMNKIYLKDSLPQYKSSIVKKLLYSIFAIPLWVSLIDNFRDWLFLPKGLRYKFYFLVIVALSYHYSERDL